MPCASWSPRASHLAIEFRNQLVVMGGYSPSLKNTYTRDVWGMMPNGSWVSYGLGALNRNLPSYVVLTSLGNRGAQPLYSRLWASGFLPTEHSGVKLRNTGAPVFYLSNPPGIDRPLRRDMLDDLASLNREQIAVTGDPETEARIAQYEMAFRMQASVPELADISGEPKSVLNLYGPDVTKPGTFARNCLLACRLAVRDVRFIQLFHMGWDHHSKLAEKLPTQAATVDQAAAGLIRDLKQRGLLEDTLVIWGGEFGRTPDSSKKDGRDHNANAMAMWFAGGGVKPGQVIGATDKQGAAPTTDAVGVNDLLRTIHTLMGIDSDRTYLGPLGRPVPLVDGGKFIDALV